MDTHVFNGLIIDWYLLCAIVFYWNCLICLQFVIILVILYMYLLLEFDLFYKSFTLIYIHKFYSPRACYI